MGKINRGGLPDLDLDFSKSRGGLPDLDLDPTRLDFCRDIIPLEISRPYLVDGEYVDHWTTTTTAFTIYGKQSGPIKIEKITSKWNVLPSSQRRNYY